MKKLVALTLSILLLLPIAACGNGQSTGSGNKTITLGTTGQSYPNSYKDGDNLVGFDVEVAETIAKRLNYKVKWVTVDFAGLIGQLDGSKIDSIANAVAVTPERAEKYAFSTPYSYYATQVATNKANTQIKSLKDLEGKTVAGVLGSNNVKSLQAYDSKIKIKTYETRDGAISDAVKNQVAGFVNTRPILKATIEKNKLPLKIIDGAAAEDKVAFPFLKNAKGKKLQKAFDKELKKMQEDGTLKKISEKYFDEDITVEK
ncbi:transporter substrate-binding domain-containing protein [Sporolactobacillus sp. STSJ-5]|uniref:transporter substrate-binding domain-containing protein n=1 Tax=Sporolactobacillus sp. STSJ-5 TaxID=2965076 RepID=UPI0021085A01|nr:transporter substrate-binding domain-containing protein [Sporolactobacillus sp. STSJ-5]MCQ2009578.1 transporter substrate-binding domain-containing protein [Sporolactobacillus sp. STSJ-5]